MSEPSTPSAETAAIKKSTWEIVLTTTPVILTILGTLLAGVSSSEMTQSQFYRSLAGQSQSKAGDQWGFFQAKRIRGQGLESTLELLPSVARFATVDPALLEASADRLVRKLQSAEKDATRLQEAVAKAEASRGDSGKPLRQAADALVAASRKDTERAKAARVNLGKELASEGAKASFQYVGTGKLPEVKDAALDDPQVDAVLKAIAERLPDEQAAPLVLALKPGQLRKAVDTAEGNAVQFDRAARPISRTLETIDRDVAALVRPVAAFHQALLGFDAELADVPGSQDKGLADVRAAVDAVMRGDTLARAAAEDLTALLKAARFDYDARRYRMEANYNQKVAALFEVQVREHSVASDRHRNRSRQFFYGMLCAQAGVAIASLSLAARQKSVLWAIAGVAGLTALAFSLYVYLYQ